MVRQAKSRARKPSVPEKPSPVSRISKIGSLKRFSNQDQANALLHQVAKLVAPIIHENRFIVGTLCEMYPKNPNLLGLNVNRGQKILIRLRYHSNENLFYPLTDIIGTFLHELTHNLYGAHDNKFYRFLDKLKARFEEVQYNPSSVKGYIAIEETLGSSYAFNQSYKSINEKRIEKLGKGIFKAEARKLGGVIKSGKPVRQLMLEAAERRLKDSKWCPSEESNIKDCNPDIEEVDLIDVKELPNLHDGQKVIDLTQDSGPAQVLNEVVDLTDPSPAKLKEYKEVVDLADEEIPGVKSDIIVIDACERPESKSESDTTSVISTSPTISHTVPSITSQEDSHPKTDLLPSFEHSDKRFGETIFGEAVSDNEEEIQYTFSSSPKTFIFNETELHHPRRKMVADLNFEQIMKKGEKIRVYSVSGNDAKFEPLKEAKKTEKKVKRKLKPRKKSIAVPGASNSGPLQQQKKTVKSIDFAELLK